jgi:pilus assembly protein CpaC
MLRALQQNGALRSLAEPNLIAMNGQEASFLAGGEYPRSDCAAAARRQCCYIVIQGIRRTLNFKPTIIDEDPYRLGTEPEVSTLDFANGVRIRWLRSSRLEVATAKNRS